MNENTKDRRINIRLDEDTYFAIKKIVEKDLKTDISSYCRSLLWISTLHDATILRIMKDIKIYHENMDHEALENMIKVKNEIESVEKILHNMKENRKKYDEHILMIEKRHETIKTEARKFFNIYNNLMDDWEKEWRDYYGDEYDTNPTIDKPGEKIIIE